MDRFRKKLKRKYNELCRVSLFLDDNEQSEKAENIVKRIKHERDLENITELDADIKELIQKSDTDDDGFISLNEFEETLLTYKDKKILFCLY